MAIAFYLLPMETVVDGRGETIQRPRYVGDPQVVRWGQIRYGRTDDAIVMIDAPQGYLNNVAGQPDATRLANESQLDDTLNTPQANAAKTIFEAAFIPGQFINAGDTRRQVIRAVVGMFLFSQRMEGAFGTGWRQRAQAAGVTLNTAFVDFPTVLQNELIAVRDDHGWTNQQLGVTGASTLREIMQAISQQFEQTPILIAGYEI